MPITEDSRYAAVSTVLLKEQVREADAIHRARERELGGKVRKAEVYREIFAAGLRAVSVADDSISVTSTNETEAVA